VHDAVRYRTPGELLSGIGRFVADGLAAGDPVLVVAPGETLDRIRAGRPDPGRQVSMLDMREVGRNPAGIIGQVLLGFARTHPGRRVRIIGEPIWPDRTDEEYPACVQHEALINSAFAGWDWHIRCLYDAARLRPDWLADAARTHPLIGTGDRITPSAHYQDPTTTTARFNTPLPEPPAGAVRLAVRPGTLGLLRETVAEQAAAAGLPGSRAGDLTIALNELVTNSIQYGGGVARAAVWPAGDRVAGQVSDLGHITDPLAGRVPLPAGVAGGGRGLVVVNALCDLVRVYTRPGHTTVRVYLRR
jgi:anti-sigma regulatory factor (Ser/Thr protein kinase)